MNERIEQLAEQAKFMAEEDINKQISYNAELKAFAEKFAELIIRECQFAIVSRTDLPKHERKLYNNVLKEHFGIKE